MFISDGGDQLTVVEVKVDKMEEPALPVAQFEKTVGSINENGGQFVAKVILNSPASEEIKIKFTTSGGFDSVSKALEGTKAGEGDFFL